MAWSLSPDDLDRQSLAIEHMSIGVPSDPKADLEITHEFLGRRVIRTMVSVGYASMRASVAAGSLSAQVMKM